MATYNEPLILTSAPGAPTSSVNKTTVDRPLTMEEWNTMAIGKPKGKATPLPVLPVSYTHLTLPTKRIV